VKQEQFLEVVSMEEARTRWHAALDLSARPVEYVPLDDALGRVLGEDVRATGDVPAFDRSNVDGFAVRATDTFGASERHPVRMPLGGAPIDAGHAPAGTLPEGAARAIATGGVVPRGANAIVMVEDTEFEDAPLEDTGAEDGVVLVHKPVAPGGRISPAGSDIARGEMVLRRGTHLSARETGTLAACGIATVPCVARLRVAVISTGDEIVAPGVPLRTGQVHDANATLIADALREMGAQPVVLGIVPDDEAFLRAVFERAKDCDATLLSGGTSKGGGDLSYRVLEKLAPPVVHGVALKPGKPICLSAWARRPVAILPGFPTSAIFTFHALVAPVLRKLMGLRERDAARVHARLPRHMRSDVGRREFTLVNLLRGRDGLLAFPLGKGSGSVTTFARADGFFEVPAAVEYVEEGEAVEVTLLGRDVHPADLVVVGSHCVGLDHVLDHVIGSGHAVKVLSTGSRGGVDAAEQGACDVAPIHLYDAERKTWNEPFAPPGARLLRGYVRRQGLAYRSEQAPRMEDGEVGALVAALAGDGSLHLANRNPGSGTRILVDELLDAGADGFRAPPGCATAYRSHTAVAAAIAQGRADYGICLEQAAHAAGLRWRPWREEHYDFLVPGGRWDTPGTRAFRAALEDEGVRARLREAGFRP